MLSPSIFKWGAGQGFIYYKTQLAGVFGQHNCGNRRILTCMYTPPSSSHVIAQSYISCRLYLPSIECIGISSISFNLKLAPNFFFFVFKPYFWSAGRKSMTNGWILHKWRRRCTCINRYNRESLYIIIIWSIISLALLCGAGLLIY